MTQQPNKISKTAGGVSCAAVTDVGMRRANNQDSMAVALADDQRLFESRGHVFVVADGMGAHAAGELASKIAADNIPHTYLKRDDLPPGEALAEALRDANTRINSKGQNSIDFQGMGTTCSCLALLPSGAVVAHVGDSRVYRLRGDAIEQLTFDHSLVWEMGLHGQASEEEVPAYVPRNVITRSLGPNATVKVDLEGPLVIRKGDVYLLCSDGLTGPLSSQLLGIVIGALPPEDAAQTLVDLANLLGGPDNITVVVAKVDETADFAQAASNPSDDTLAMTDSSVPLGGARYATLGVAGAAAVAAVAFFALSNPMPGVAALTIAALAAAGWWVLGRTEAPAPVSIKVSFPQGQAPYRRYEVTPSTENIETLSDIVRQLEDLETQHDWQFDWSDIHEDRHRAHQAIASGNFHDATVAYCSAVRKLMQAVRENGPGGPSDSSINLGFE